MAIQDKAPKKMTRRDFVKSTSVIGAALVAPSILINSANSEDRVGMVDTAFKGSSTEFEKENVETAEIKYEKYFTKDVVRENKWGGEGMGLSSVSGDIIPAGAKMTLGISVVRKPYMFHETTHKHIFTEFFFFFGSNPMDLNKFDADVEFSFGAEREKHVISSPTIVTAAPGVYHCPLNYARVGKPFYCVEAFMTSEYSGIDLGQDSTEIRIPEPNYDRYFTKDVVRENKWGGEAIDLEESVQEAIIPAGARMELIVSVVRKPYMFHETTHKHDFTEFFFFFGSNPMDLNEFDADIEFSFGTEREKHVISSPTIVTVPPGVYHCPLNYARVGKPFYCLEAFLTSEYSRIDL
jgi:hypothetical protein